MRNEHDHEPTSLTLDEVTQNAKEMLLAKGKQPPTLLLEGEQRILAVLLEDLVDTHQGRMRQMFVVGFAVTQGGGVGKLKQAFFISEAWMNSAKPGDTRAVLPSQDPKRREVLLVSNFFPDDRETEVKVIEMLRDSKGVLRELKEEPAQENWKSQVGSPLIDAFVAGYRAGRASPTDPMAGGELK